jgi:hypothetical protein
MTSPEVLRVVWLGLTPVSSIGTISKYAMACLAGLVPYVKPKNQKPVDTEGQCHQSQHPPADRKNQFIENKSVLLYSIFFDEELKK